MVCAMIIGAKKAPTPKQECSPVINGPTLSRYIQTNNVLSPTFNTPSAAPEIIKTLRGFFKFLHRAYKLKNAKECLEVLDDYTEADLAEAMADSSNFGMAKAFFTMGQQAGFDMSTRDGLNRWMAAFNSGNAGPEAR